MSVSRAEDVPVTAGAVARYVQTHTQPPDALEVLIVTGEMAYVRWPNDAIRWHTAASLRARGFNVPAIGLLQTRPA